MTMNNGPAQPCKRDRWVATPTIPNKIEQITSDEINKTPNCTRTLRKAPECKLTLAYFVRTHHINKCHLMFQISSKNSERKMLHKFQFGFPTTRCDSKKLASRPSLGEEHEPRTGRVAKAKWDTERGPDLRTMRCAETRTMRQRACRNQHRRTKAGASSRHAHSAPPRRATSEASMRTEKLATTELCAALSYTNVRELRGTAGASRRLGCRLRGRRRRTGPPPPAQAPSEETSSGKMRSARMGTNFQVRTDPKNSPGRRTRG